jgi:type I restriction enzyme S subunit
MKKGWQTKRLGDVCEIIKGRKPVLKATPSDGDLPYLVAKVMRGSEEAQYASVKDRNSVTVVESETIIICDGSNSGEVFAGFRGILSSTMGKISKKADIDDNYLRAFLASTFEVFNGAKTGAAIPHLDKQAMYQLQFPLPPLPEQQRIVGILDEAFEGIASAKANAEKNLQNARALFESHHDSVFTKRRENWVGNPLGDVCEYVNGKAHEQCIHDDGRFIVINSKFISSEGEVLKRSNEALLLLKRDDIAMVLSDVPNGNALAKCFLVDEDNTYTLNQRICLIRSTKFHPKFLFYQLNRNRHFLAFDNGENQTNLRLNQVLSCPLFLPPLSEQEAIAANLDAMSEETQRLESLYERKLAALEALKKSLLHQAFTDQLASAQARGSSK